MLSCVARKKMTAGLASSLPVYENAPFRKAERWFRRARLAGLAGEHERGMLNIASRQSLILPYNQIHNQPDHREKKQRNQHDNGKFFAVASAPRIAVGPNADEDVYRVEKQK